MHRATRRALLLSFALASAGCSGDDDVTPGSAETAAVLAGSAPDRQADEAPTPEIARRAEMPPPWSGDPGIGVFRFAWHEDRPRDASADTIRVRADPHPASPVVARFIYTFGAATAPETPWGWSVQTLESGLIANDMEFDYEENGLPIDSIAGDWVRVIHAHTEAGEPRTGWTLRRPDTDVLLWPDQLRESNLFFIDPAAIAFHSSAGGPRTEIALAPGDGTLGFDYTMYPEEIRERWMRVRIVTPSDYCRDPANAAEHTTWIEFLDARGRPRVFYHTRGC